MNKEKFIGEIYKAYKNKKKELENIKQTEISGDNMVNIDIEKTIKAMFYQEIDEIFRRLKENGR